MGATVFDATPDPAGAMIYVTGLDPTLGPGVLSVSATAATPATPTTVQAGAPFVAPFGISISTDGTTLYVADLGADSANPDPTGTNDTGQIFSLPVAGGAPTAITGANGYRPRSVQVVANGSADDLYFTGTDPTNGKAGVFMVAAAGGSVTTVLEGAPFVEPSGVAVATDGSVYVLDSLTAHTGAATILKVSGTPAAASTVTTANAGYPGGIALLCDGSSLLASTLDPAKYTDVVLEINTTTPTMTTPLTTGVSGLYEAAGIHRAAKANIFAFVDSGSTGPMTGQVFVVK
jgi:sugar lactone lactonase YvrE